MINVSINEENYLRENYLLFKKKPSIESNSSFKHEIDLFLAWRDNHKLNFPTKYLELVVNKALENCGKKNLLYRMIRILDFLKKDFLNEKFYDASRKDVLISDCINYEEKRKIQICSRISLNQEYIGDIISE